MSPNANNSNSSSSRSSSRSHLLSLTDKCKVYLKKDEEEPETIAIRMNRDLRVIKKLIFNSTNTKSFTTQHNKKGRFPKGSTKLNQRQRNLLNDWTMNNKVSSVRTAWRKLLRLKNLPHVSLYCVQQYLKDRGTFVTPTQKTIISRKNKETRLRFCRQHRRFDFSRVMFTDESSFQINYHKGKMWRVRGSAMPRVPLLNPNHKIMVWGGVCYDGKTKLYVVEGTLDAEKYVRLLRARRQEMRSLMRRAFWFQQDNAPCHKSDRVGTYIRRYSFIITIINYILRYLTNQIVDHPPQSPDLNPIELVWAKMKRDVEQQGPTTKRALLMAIMAAWDRIDIPFIRQCIDNIHKKMRLIISKDGAML
jgi:hypothetical protein